MVRRGSAMLVALGALSLLTCDPTPDYPPAQQPVIDTILDEATAHTSGTEQTLELAYTQMEERHRVSVSLPAASYPKGTWVTVRLLTGVFKLEEDPLVLSEFLQGSGSATYNSALQILPDDLAPAVPLRVELRGWGEFWNFDVVHARVGDRGWVVDKKNLAPVVTHAQASRPSALLSFDVSAPGLWSVTMPNTPPQLQGLLNRNEVQCDDQSVPNPRTASLTLSGDKYVWRRQSASGCDEVETGEVKFDSASAGITFHSDSGLYDYRGLSFMLDRNGGDITGLWLEGYAFNECQDTGYGLGREHYVHEPGSEKAPPAPLDGGCPADAGAARD